MKPAAVLVALLLVATPAAALPLLPPPSLSPTNCSGSWDGPGMSTCELFGGVPGVMGAPALMDWSLYTFDPEPVLSITLYSQGHTWVDQLGQLVHQREPGGRVFSSLLHPEQFALWTNCGGNPSYVCVGIEDLAPDDITNGRRGSDYDMDDFVWLAWLTSPDPEEPSIPEPAQSALLLLGAAGVARRMMRRP